jgi:2-methylisocitrate lyase-like PEP mutase family enzyme
MTTAEDKRATFGALHRGDLPLLMPNPWDRGSARLLASLGFAALATTSGGFAAGLGRADYGVTREEALGHAAELAAVVDVPLSADLENGFDDRPEGVARTVRGAVEAGLAGCSIEDYTTRADEPLYDLSLAVERVAAAAEAAHAGPGPGLVLTARAENYLRGRPDLADTVVRLQAFARAGADVLYAPGLRDLADISTLVAEVDRPVNVLVRPGMAPVAALAEAGVARISVGSAFCQVAAGAVARAAGELLGPGSYGWLELAEEGRDRLAAATG